MPETQTSVGDVPQCWGRSPAMWTYVVSLEREFNKLSDGANMRRYEGLCATKSPKQIRRQHPPPPWIFGVCDMATNTCLATWALPRRLSLKPDQRAMRACRRCRMSV